MEDCWELLTCLSKQGQHGLACPCEASHSKQQNLMQRSDMDLRTEYTHALECTRKKRTNGKGVKRLGTLGETREYYNGNILEENVMVK